MKEVNVKTEIIIRRPLSEVSLYAAHPDNVTRWYRNIYEVKWLVEPKLEVGSQIAFKARFLGKQIAYVYEIMEWLPSKRLTMQTSSGPFPMQTIYEWEEVNGATKMTLINRGRPSGFSRLLTPFMTKAMRKANEKDLLLLKQVLENTNHQL